MKARVRELSSKAVWLKNRLVYGSVKLFDDAIVKIPELHFRKDDRTAEEVFKANGFTGRQFTGCPVEMATYIQLSTPKIGYSGCRTLKDSIEWSLEVAESVGRKKANPPPQNIYVSIVDPKSCQLVWVPTLAQLNNIGFMTDSAGCRIRIHDDSGKVIGFENRYVPEQELLVIGEIPVINILACVAKEDHQRFKDHEPVVNQMHQFNPNLVETVQAKDFRNYSAILSALLQANKTEVAKIVAERMSVERVLAESKANDFEPKNIDRLFHFVKASQNLDQRQEAIELSSNGMTTKF